MNASGIFAMLIFSVSFAQADTTCEGYDCSGYNFWGTDFKGNLEVPAQPVAKSLECVGVDRTSILSDGSVIVTLNGYVYQVRKNSNGSFEIPVELSRNCK